MKKIGTSIIFINDQEEILLFLRDDLPDIKYPNMWDLLGGNLEGGETPEECIVREIREEIGLEIEDFELFEERDFLDRFEYTFWKRLNLNTENVVLNEGQRLKWFAEKEARTTPLAFGFNITVENFFRKKPYKL